MNRYSQEELQSRLAVCHQEFIDLLNGLSANQFMQSPEGKWNAGQQLHHIIKSVTPVSTAFGLPPFILRTLFGKANRKSRSYEELVDRYQSKLAAGGVAPSQFLPRVIQPAEKKTYINKLQNLVKSLNKRMLSKSESQLDRLLLPHPLLGKITLREMLYFTIYHVQHHQKQVVSHLHSSSST